ncbi:MAG: UDP-N-acetylmuramate dehydrogenase [Paludibacter sp.]|nr:UDP-N-acetylmuramate dehydrogenase [Paludibacter sp.]
MKIKENFSLLPHNTFGLNIKTDFFIEFNSVEELQMVLQSDIVKSNRVLCIGGGSNLLFLSDFKGVVLHSNIQSVTIIKEDADSVFLEVGSGVNWDDLVAHTVENGWGGIENLSLIPGETGASALQNIGAYGVEVQDVIEKVKAVNISTGKVHDFSHDECRYGYRSSTFKNEMKGAYSITSVILKLSKKPVFKLNYPHLEEEVLKTGEISLTNIRKTIITIRESKLPDPKILGNAGSFFINPVISKQHFEALQTQFPEIPHYFVSETQEKVPAAWLIEQCGWKGKQIGNAGVHDKQALVLVNLCGATGSEIVHLAEQIQLSVQVKFGVELIPEVNYI